MGKMANSKDEEADEELLGQLKLFDEIKKRSTFKHRFCRFWKSLKLRSALGHFGLMISLSIYCVVGGVVSMSKQALLLNIWFTDFANFCRSFHSAICSLFATTFVLLAKHSLLD